MSLLQGNTYKLEIPLNDPEGNVINNNFIKRAQFAFGDYIKYYDSDGSGEVSYDTEKQCYIVPLTEEETFAMRQLVTWQVRVLYINGEIDGTQPITERVSDSIITVRLGE